MSRSFSDFFQVRDTRIAAEFATYDTVNRALSEIAMSNALSHARVSNRYGNLFLQTGRQNHNSMEEYK
jgi:hypothetical protein